MALPPELIGDSRLHELLEEDAFDDACTLLQEMLPIGRKPIAGYPKRNACYTLW